MSAAVAVLSPSWAIAGLFGNGRFLVCWRSTPRGICKEQMSSGALHYCYSFGMCLHISIDGEDKWPLRLPPGLYSSCSFDVSLPFHLLFLLSLSFTETVFFRGVSCVCQQLLLLRQQVLMDGGVPAFCKMCSTPKTHLSLWLSLLLFWGAFCPFFPAFSVSPHLPEG